MTTDNNIPIIQPLLLLRNYSINIYILFANEKDLGNHFREILEFKGLIGNYQECEGAPGGVGTPETLHTILFLHQEK